MQLKVQLQSSASQTLRFEIETLFKPKKCLENFIAIFELKILCFPCFDRAVYVTLNLDTFGYQPQEVRTISQKFLVLLLLLKDKLLVNY